MIIYYFKFYNLKSQILLGKIVSSNKNMLAISKILFILLIVHLVQGKPHRYFYGGESGWGSEGSFGGRRPFGGGYSGGHRYNNFGWGGGESGRWRNRYGTEGGGHFGGYDRDYEDGEINIVKLVNI